MIHLFAVKIVMHIELNILIYYNRQADDVSVATCPCLEDICVVMIVWRIRQKSHQNFCTTVVQSHKDAYMRLLSNELSLPTCIFVCIFLNLGQFVCIRVAFWCIFFWVFVSLVVSSSALNWLKRFIFEVTCYLQSGT